MKKKNLKPLSLHRETVRHLNQPMLRGVLGGETETCNAGCPVSDQPTNPKDTSCHQQLQ